MVTIKKKSILSFFSDSVKAKIVRPVLPLFVELLAHHSHSNQNVTLKAAEALRELSTDSKEYG
jgi:hypothetical protein